MSSFVDPPYQGWKWTPDEGTTFFPPPGGPGLSFSAEVINAAGQVAGASPWQYGNESAWRLDMDEATFVGVLPDMTWSIPTGMNEAGDIVGFGNNWSPVVNSEQFFFYSDDTGLLQIPEVPGPLNTVNRINDSQVVTGTIKSPSAAYRWSPGDSEVELLPWEFGWSSGRDINNLGQICGALTFDDGSPPYNADAGLYTEGVGWELLNQPINTTRAVALNNHEVVIGETSIPGPDFTWVWTRDTEVRELAGLVNPADTPANFIITDVHDINDAGQILASGISESFVLTPVDLEELTTPGELVYFGDLNEDDIVGINDLLILLGAWNTTDEGDLNSDEATDILDLLLLLANWNS